MSAMRSVSAESVDDFLKKGAEDARIALKKLRKIIKEAVPKKTEVIKYQGHPLGAFAQPGTAVRSIMNSGMIS